MKTSKIPITCKVCGTVRYVKKGVAEKDNPQFCSKKCYAINKKASGLFKKGEYRECGICKKEIYVQQWQIARGHGKFCSAQCRHIHLSKIFKGESSYAWKGGQYIDSHGYVYLRAEGHPRVANNYVKRAVLVLENKIERYLSPGEISHHVNGVKNDDRPENLEVMTRDAHNKYHASLIKGFDSRVNVSCEHCGLIFKDRITSNRRFCSHSCTAKHLKPRLGTGRHATF
ncbi:MAG: hypothetical protein AAB922_04735 [Patescibacteria group bacterium]